MSDPPPPPDPASSPWSSPSDPPSQPPQPPPGYPPPGYPPPGYPPPYAHQPPGPPRELLASFGSRLVAWIIDGAILSAAAFATVIAVVTVLATGPNHESTCTTYETSAELGEVRREEPCTLPDRETVALAVMIGLAGTGAYIVVTVYYFRRLGRTGSSWGRTAMGIRVLDATTGLTIGAWRAFGRQIVAGIASASLCYLGYFWMLWDPMSQTWHDKILSTVVVKDRDG